MADGSTAKKRGHPPALFDRKNTCATVNEPENPERRLI
jgi:hypothetical protein